MAVSFFDSKAVTPDDTMVANVLADTHQLWIELQEYVQENFPDITGEWKFYGKTAGWSYKVISKKRGQRPALRDDAYYVAARCVI